MSENTLTDERVAVIQRHLYDSWMRNMTPDTGLAIVAFTILREAVDLQPEYDKPKFMFNLVDCEDYDPEEIVIASEDVYTGSLNSIFKADVVKTVIAAIHARLEAESTSETSKLIAQTVRLQAIMQDNGDCKLTLCWGYLDRALAEKLEEN